MRTDCIFEKKTAPRMEWFCAAKGGAECSGAETER